jgi:hypothetical protein
MVTIITVISCDSNHRSTRERLIQVTSKHYKISQFSLGSNYHRLFYITVIYHYDKRFTIGYLPSGTLGRSLLNTRWYGRVTYLPTIKNPTVCRRVCFRRPLPRGSSTMLKVDGSLSDIRFLIVITSRQTTHSGSNIGSNMHAT